MVEFNILDRLSNLEDKKGNVPFLVIAMTTRCKMGLFDTTLNRWKAKKYPQKTVPINDITKNSCKYFESYKGNQVVVPQTVHAREQKAQMKQEK